MYPESKIAQDPMLHLHHPLTHEGREFPDKDYSHLSVAPRLHMPPGSGNLSRSHASHSNSVAPQTSGSLSPLINSPELNSTYTSKSLDFHALKRSRSPTMPTSGASSMVSHNLEADLERETRAKAKRLARFGVELSQPLQNVNDLNRNISSEVKPRYNLVNRNMEVDCSIEETAALQEENEMSAAIVGMCQDMCPESERQERERKGDLDQYERWNGDRNQSHISLAVKKYNRTAERSALLIRPMPVLTKTMDYLMHLLDQPYDDKFLGIYNFLWDRMRAVRMDLRMQHIFNQNAIIMLEQMIRLHIVAMHELCEYAKGEGFSEGFDAHLNIEQMNKSSVELFQMYDDHRKKGLPVRSENEFRGYYALLKLDRHPGYKVEPAELSLDLAKMTRNLRGTREILFARQVARACRTGNFIAFFRLAKKATYLQACLMHAHFSKLRTNALASLHSSLQNNQGIPVAQVVQWLGMEGEDIERLLKYHGFVIKIFEEAYMVKDGPFLSNDADYTTRSSELVHSKKSRKIVDDILANHVVSTSRVMDGTEVNLRSFTSKPVPKITNPSVISDIREASNWPRKVEESPQPTTRKKSVYEGIKTPVKNQFTTLDVGMPDSEDAVSNIHGNSQPFVTETSPSLLHGNIEYTRENDHQNNVTTIPRIDVPIHHDIFMDDQVSEPDKLNTGEELLVMTEEGVMQNQTAPTSAMVSMIERLPYQKEMLDQRAPEDELLLTARENSEASRQKLRMIIRTWKQWASRKRGIREHRQELANMALSSIPLGPLIHPSEIQSSDTGEKLNIDAVLKERNERHRQSRSRLNVACLVGSTLYKKNPDAKCLLWKVAICMQKLDKEKNVHSLISTWLLSKLLDSRGNSDELAVVSPGLCIWKSLVDGRDSYSPSLCLSVVREVLLENQSRGALDDAVLGSNAIIYIVSGSVPWEMQRVHMNNLLTSLPSESRLPMLILIDNTCNIDAQLVVSKLGLEGIYKTKLNGISVVSVAEDILGVHVGGFFNDGNLRDGLKWLAEQTLPQPSVHIVRTRELVLSHLNSLLKTSCSLGPLEIDLNHCIMIFNEALDQSAKHIQNAADMNPNLWPCPESDLLHRQGIYLPAAGWSSAAITKKFVDALRSCKLPHFSYDLSFLSQGSHLGKQLQLQIMMLEECLVDYLTQSAGIMSDDLARNQAHLMLQKGAAIELHGIHYYLIPRWLVIFQHMYNWRLRKLTGRECASAYVSITVATNMFKLLQLGDLNGSSFLESEPVMYGTFQFENSKPSLDEMLQVIHHFPSEQEAAKQGAIPDTGSDKAASQLVASADKGTSLDEDFRFSRPSEAEATISPPMQNRMSAIIPVHSSSGSAKLRMLLEQCEIVQDRNDQKLSVYFGPSIHL